jgi:competence protein ComGC
MSADGHDQWHQHTADEGAPQEEHAAQASAKALGLTFIGMTLGVLFVIIILVVYFQNYMSNYRSMINENTDAAAVSWDEKQGHLNKLEDPLAQAMEVVIEEYASN